MRRPLDSTSSDLSAVRICASVNPKRSEKMGLANQRLPKCPQLSRNEMYMILKLRNPQSSTNSNNLRLASHQALSAIQHGPHGADSSGSAPARATATASAAPGRRFVST